MGFERPRGRRGSALSIWRALTLALTTVLALSGAGCASAPGPGGAPDAAPRAERVDFDPVASSPAQRARIDALRARLVPIVAAAAKRGPESLLLLEQDALYAPLPTEDRQLLEAIRSQPGAEPAIGIPADVEWVRLEGQVVHGAKGDQTIPLQLVTAPVHEALVRLDHAMRRDLGRGLLVGSAYRSPAYQLSLIVDLMPRFDYSLEKTTAHVTLPGASDHNRVDRLGVDFVSEAGVDLAWTDAAAFIALPEYRWLLAHGAEYGFAPDPVAAGAPVGSPWHWRFLGR